MKNDVTEAKVVVAIPSQLYEALFDPLPARGRKLQPAATLLAALRRQLVASRSAPEVEVSRSPANRDWCDDWITFQSPPIAGR